VRDVNVGLSESEPLKELGALGKLGWKILFQTLNFHVGTFTTRKSISQCNFAIRL
jgi:hypothetical protein